MPSKSQRNLVVSIQSKDCHKLQYLAFLKVILMTNRTAEATMAKGDQGQNETQSSDASIRFLQETSVAQRLAATERMSARFSPSSEDDVLVMSPLSAWRQSGTFIEVPEVTKIGGKEYTSHTSQFVPDGGKYDPFEGIDVHKKLRLKAPPASQNKEAELHNPVHLADAATRLLEKNGNRDLSKGWLDRAAKSSHGMFTERERATADLLYHNYELFSSFDGKDKISVLDVSVLKDEAWWNRVLEGRTHGEINSRISDPSLLKGSAETFKNTTTDKGHYIANAENHFAAERRLREQDWARFNKSTNSNDCNAVSSGLAYGLGVYALLKVLGNDHAAGWGMAAGAAKTYQSSKHCNR